MFQNKKERMMVGMKGIPVLTFAGIIIAATIGAAVVFLLFFDKKR